nr:hypothetical protein [Microbacterium bovistercoris]
MSDDAPEPLRVTVARVDERTLAMAREIKEIKATLAAQTTAKPQWPAMVAAVAAAGAIVLTLAMNL